MERQEEATGKGGRLPVKTKEYHNTCLKIFSKWQWRMKAFAIIQNKRVVCSSYYYLGLTARSRLCTKVKGKLPAQRTGRQPKTEAASTGLCACPATDPRVMQSCGHIVAVVCLPRYHGRCGWLWVWENHILIPFFRFGRNGNPYY